MPGVLGREHEASTLDSRAHVQHAQWIPSNNMVDMNAPKPLIAAHRHSYNAAQHASGVQERARDLPATHGAQSLSQTAAEQRSRSGNLGSSLTAADLETESGIVNSADKQRCHDFADVTPHFTSTGTPPRHLDTSQEVEQPLSNYHGAVERLTRRTSRSQPQVSGHSFDNTSPCLSNGMSQHVQSKFLPISASPLNAQVGPRKNTNIPVIVYCACGA